MAVKGGILSARDRIDPMEAVIATAAFARLQITYYDVMKSVAEAAGEGELAATCEAYRREQAEFAKWLDEKIPELLAQAGERH